MDERVSLFQCQRRGQLFAHLAPIPLERLENHPGKDADGDMDNVMGDE